MIRHFIFQLITLLISIQVYSQLNPTVTPVIDQYGIILEKRAQPSGIQGSVYLNDVWTTATLYLAKGKISVDKIENVSIKVDIKTNAIEINLPNTLKVIDGAKVEKFEWVNLQSGRSETYTNCNALSFGTTKLIGFCKILPGAKLQLGTYNYIELVKADYNVALDVGSREDKLVKKSRLFLIKENKMFEVGKKTLYTLMADKESAIKKYIKDNDVNINKEEELSLVVDYYNSIF